MRWLERLDALYEIGGGPGANRVGYTPAEDEAHELAAGWLREAGLEVEVDAHGNLIGRRRGDEPELPEVWTGSHLDSVPQGGRYDGALGVVAGIEALERLGRQRGRSQSWPSGTRSAAARAAGAASARCRSPAPSSSCTTSRGRGSSRPALRSAWLPASSATSAASRRSPAAPVTRARRRWRAARMRSSRRLRRSCASATSRARSTARSRPSATWRSSPAASTSSPAACA